MNKPLLLQHCLEISADKFPTKEVLKHKQESLSYQELLSKTQHLGLALKKANLPKGSRVGILLDKSIAQVISILGVLYADLVFVIINPILHEEQIKHILNDCETKIVISNSKFSNILDKILPQTSVDKVILEDEFESIINKTTSEKVASTNKSSDNACIIYTSGSTGLPKGIVITHQNLLDGARIVSQYLKIAEHERILSLLPLNFDYGLNQLTSTLYKGCSLVLFQYFMPNSLLKILDTEKITGLAAIPPIWTAVFNDKLTANLDKYDFSHLRYITNSGGKLPIPIIKNIRKHLPKTDLYLMYGLTEAFRSTYLDPKEVDKRPDSMGKAIPDVRVEVIDKDGNICQPDQPGELIHLGACISKGYWNDPEKTAKVFRPNPLEPNSSEIVVYSGDLVKKDQDGFLYFISRNDAMIKTGGYRVSPTEVEELLLSNPTIADAIVFGLEDIELGYKIRAIVQLKGKTTAEEIQNDCKTKAPTYLVPKEIFIVDSFPKTASGKIDRPKVKKESIEKHGN